jgi:hypothetical protein
VRKRRGGCVIDVLPNQKAVWFAALYFIVDEIA